MENTANSLLGVLGDFFRVRLRNLFKLCIFNFFQSVSVSRSLLDTTSRKDDVVYTMPGPWVDDRIINMQCIFNCRPYNYDLNSVIDLRSNHFRGQHSQTSSRKTDTAEESNWLKIESSSVEDGEDKDFTTIDKHLGVPVDVFDWESTIGTTQEPLVIPLHRAERKRPLSRLV